MTASLSHRTDVIATTVRRFVTSARQQMRGSRTAVNTEAATRMVKSARYLMDLARNEKGVESLRLINSRRQWMAS